MARSRLILCAAVAGATALAGAMPAEAQNRRSGAQRTQDEMMASIPTCARNLGTIAIADGQADVFRELQLSPPQSLLRAVIQRSGCFTLLDRGAGMSLAVGDGHGAQIAAAARNGRHHVVLGALSARTAVLGLGGQGARQGRGARDGGAENKSGSSHMNLPGLIVPIA